MIEFGMLVVLILLAFLIVAFLKILWDGLKKLSERWGWDSEGDFCPACAEGWSYDSHSHSHRKDPK